MDLQSLWQPVQVQALPFSFQVATEVPHQFLMGIPQKALRGMLAPHFPSPCHWHLERWPLLRLATTGARQAPVLSNNVHLY